MLWCKDCKEIKFDGHHCDPSWLVWSPEDGETEDDGRVFYGMSPDRAVEKWAEWSDRNSADYSIVGGQEATVHVRLAEGQGERAEFLRLQTEEIVFNVYGESVPEYTAQRVPQRPPQATEKKGEGR
jgi:hypothetical protein